MVAETTTRVKPMPTPKASPATTVRTDTGTRNTVATMSTTPKMRIPHAPRSLIPLWNESLHSFTGRNNHPTINAISTPRTDDPFPDRSSRFRFAGAGYPLSRPESFAKDYIAGGTARFRGRFRDETKGINNTDPSRICAGNGDSSGKPMGMTVCGTRGDGR